jgi:hypothetical protein
MLRTEDFAAYKFLPRVLAAAQHLNGFCADPRSRRPNSLSSSKAKPTQRPICVFHGLALMRKVQHEAA